MKRKTLQTGAKIALAAILMGGMATPAQAQFGNLKDLAKREAEKKAAKEIKRAIDEVGTTSESSTATIPNAPVRMASTGGAPKPTEITQCDGLRPSKITYGRLGDYTFQNGMSTETRTGFINRRDVSFESGCILPNLRSGDVMYLEYDSNALNTKGSFETQCIKIDDRAYGAVNVAEGRAEYPSNDSYLGEAHMRLACGNSEGISDCTNGKNRDRANAARQDLDARGKTALSFYMTKSRASTTPKSGERLYCQYYNSSSGKSLFGYEYFREYG